MDTTFLTRKLVTAAALFLCGFLCFIIAFATPSWLHVSEGIHGGLWSKCLMVKEPAYWTCESWAQPTNGFITASQAFAVMALLLYVFLFIAMIVTVVSMVQDIPYRKYIDRKCVLMILAVSTFSAASLAIMSGTVMGIKGKDYVYDLQRNEYIVFSYNQRRIDITGPLNLGWSFVVNVLAAIFTYASFAFLAAEYKLLPEEDEQECQENV
ncbi:uncharacterized protein [Argopecten irradians]|uniref:uncharacterized protein n=1 Tax=Argopecten irradians TaxID=31199 RepID=UPI003720BC82